METQALRFLGGKLGMTMYVFSACFWGALLRWFWPDLGLLKWIFGGAAIAAAQWVPSFLTFIALNRDIQRLGKDGKEKEKTDDN